MRHNAAVIAGASSEGEAGAKLRSSGARRGGLNANRSSSPPSRAGSPRVDGAFAAVRSRRASSVAAATEDEKAGGGRRAAVAVEEKRGGPTAASTAARSASSTSAAMRRPTSGATPARAPTESASASTSSASGPSTAPLGVESERAEPTPRCAQYDVSTSRRRASSSRAWTSSAARRVSRSTSVSSTRRDAEAGGGGILAAPRARGRMTGRVVSRGRLAEANSPFGTTSDSHRTATARQPSQHYLKTGYSLLRETAGNLVGCADLDNEISLRTLFSSPESAATSPHTSRARHPHATEALPTAAPAVFAPHVAKPPLALDSPPRDRHAVRVALRSRAGSPTFIRRRVRRT